MLELRGVTKRFGATRALRDARLDLRAGEVHALVGENGAGKSTLIKVLTGLYRPDGGEILLDGEPLRLASTTDAQRKGIAAIYQEPMLYPDLTVAENVFLGHRSRGRLMHWGRLNHDAGELLRSLDIDLDPRQLAHSLSIGSQQAVEIAKAISLDVRLLIMDEPTAALSAHESQRLFERVRRLRERGVSILFISHRLDEVFELADRVTVFRDGAHVLTKPIGELDRATVVTAMVGRHVEDFFGYAEREPGEVVLDVRDLSCASKFRDVSFEVRAGEVVGMAGLVGAGRTEVAQSLFGIEPATSGTITLDGQVVRIRSPRDAMARGIAYLPEDRRGIGLTMDGSVASNITLPRLSDYRNRWRLIDRQRERDTAERYRKQLSIKTASVDTPVGNLSGGNQQKAMLAKWLHTEPRLLILDEPTRGVDVGAKADVHQLVAELAAAGIAVLLISSDLPEVLAMSDRVLVMRNGALAGEFSRADANPERVMNMAVQAG